MAERLRRFIAGALSAIVIGVAPGFPAYRAAAQAAAGEAAAVPSDLSPSLSLSGSASGSFAPASYSSQILGLGSLLPSGALGLGSSPAASIPSAGTAAALRAGAAPAVAVHSETAAGARAHGISPNENGPSGSSPVPSNHGILPSGAGEPASASAQSAEPHSESTAMGAPIQASGSRTEREDLGDEAASAGSSERFDGLRKISAAEPGAAVPGADHGSSAASAHQAETAGLRPSENGAGVATPDSNGPSTPAVAESPELLAKRDRIMSGFMHGQLALVAGLATFYSLVNPISLVLAGPSGVVYGGLAYTLAMAFGKPLAGALTERIPVRSLLIHTFVARAVLWTAVLAGYLALGPGTLFNSAFVTLMGVHGLISSLNSTVDVDEAGTDLLGQQYGFAVDGPLRNHYNSIMTGFFAVMRVVTLPAMALVTYITTMPLHTALLVFSGVLAFYGGGVGLAMLLSRKSSPLLRSIVRMSLMVPVMLGIVFAIALAVHSAAPALAALMAVSFVVPAIVGVRYYARDIPKETAAPLGSRGKGLGAELATIAGNVRNGFSLAFSKRRLWSRMMLAGIERTIGDLMLVVVQSAFAMTILAPHNPTIGILLTTVLTAVGKPGEILASWLMNRFWKAPTTEEARYPRLKIFFRLAFASTLLATLMAVAATVGLGGNLWLAGALAGGASFLFNLLFGAADQGFTNYTQEIATQEGATGTLLGTLGFFKWVMNLAIPSFSALFLSSAFGTPYWITAAAFVAVGLGELFVAPRLYFTPEERGKTPKK